jgi:hypothetical protein
MPSSRILCRVALVRTIAKTSYLKYNIYFQISQTLDFVTQHFVEGNWRFEGISDVQTLYKIMEFYKNCVCSFVNLMLYQLSCIRRVHACEKEPSKLSRDTTSRQTRTNNISSSKIEDVSNSPIHLHWLTLNTMATALAQALQSEYKRKNIQ